MADLVSIAAPYGPSGPSVRYLNPAGIVASKRTAVPATRQRADGYGSKIPSGWLIKVAGRWRRVYSVCWSNSATNYILLDGQFTVVSQCWDRIEQVAE